MNTSYRISTLFLIGSLIACLGSQARGQLQTTVQLPTFEVFSVQTTVMVPDGGTMMMGSVGRAAAGATSRGVPLLGSIPGAGRAFRNRGIGTETSTAGMSVSAEIISLSELEGPLLQAGNQRLAARRYATPEAIARRAEFLTQNMGTHRR